MLTGDLWKEYFVNILEKIDSVIMDHTVSVCHEAQHI